MEHIEIEELCKDSSRAIKLYYQYSTDAYYDVLTESVPNGWTVKLQLKMLAQRLEKSSESVLFEPFVERPKAFKVVFRGKDIAFLQIGHDVWNNRVRVWELLVLPEYRRMRIGSKLMTLTKAEAKALGARAIVLETQSCNVPAIHFYLKHGFQLIGFDLTHYSNDDMARKEVRLEFGLSIA